MFPELFRLGPLHISTYGAVVALAAVAAGYVLGRGFEEKGLERKDAWDAVVLGLLAGFAGGKVYYAILVGDPGMLLSRSGFVWYGGLIGGGAAVLLFLRRRRIPPGPALDAFAPALALGHGIGHIACFFSGDSYGVPTDLPWGVAFARGAPPSTAGNLREIFGVPVPAGIPDEALLRVHPTMLYSAAVLIGVFVLLWVLRSRPWQPGRLLALYLMLAGTERFFVEFLRAKDDRLLWGGLTLAQGIALALVGVGLTLLFGAFRDRYRLKEAATS